jgi:hypothetical protein
LCYTVCMPVQAPTVQAFVDAYPEFRSTYQREPAMVANALATAVLHCGPEVFGSAYAQAVMLMAAHQLAMSPFGEALRIKGDDGPTSLYFRRWQDLANSRRPRVMLGGGLPWGRF